MAASKYRFETRAAIDRGLVLHTLLGNGQLDGDVIVALIPRSPRRTCRALRTLHYLSMVRPTPDGTAWEITERGREFAMASAGAVA